ncbi:MAG TPA: site-2 protease family protein [Polyangiaceae bacterium]|nr:site-2 protease family protein [Polyangiaceae bacterium]
MSWSLRLGSVSGIAIRVHFTFALLLAAFASHLADKQGARGALFGVLLVVCLFTCVVLHELGHGLVAQRFGVTVREIVLLPIGGVARLLSEPKKPLHELLIALAGPFVNVLLALGAFLALRGEVIPSLATLPDEALTTPSVHSVLLILLYSNVSLAVFNMLPALPMDGGRVLRALLSFFFGQVRATNIAAGIAQVLAVGLALFGLQGEPILVFIALLVFMGAGQERVTTRTNVLLAELRAGEVCDPHAVTFAPGDSVGAAVDQTLRSPQAHFLVSHGSEPIGTLSRDDLIALAGRVGLHAPLTTITRRALQIVPPELPLSEVKRLLQENGGVPVVVRGKDGALGVLGLDDISRIASLTDHLARGGVRRPVPESTETSA